MTSSLTAARVGAQRPQLLHEPPGVVSSSGDEAVEYAESIGLVLDDWQAWCVRMALSETADARWAAFENAIIVPRQNGKNEIIAAIQLACIYLFEDRVLVHSAHKFDTASEHFLRLRELIQNNDELSSLLLPGDRGFVTANGKEAIRFSTGQRILFKARSRGGGRGFSGDKIFFDEAYDLPPKAIGAMLPTLSTRPEAQVYYTSSAPHPDSTVLHSLRRRALSPTAGDRLFLASWENEPDVDPESINAVYDANPAAGIRISEPYMLDERQAMLSDPELVAEYRRERLGIPDMPDGAGGVLSMAKWSTLVDIGDPLSLCIALEVDPDRSLSAFGVAGRRADQLIHVEVAELLPGTAGVVERAAELHRRYRTPIIVDPSSPAGALIPSLVAAGVEVDEMSTRELTQACGAFADAITNAEVRHIGQAQLDAAVGAARYRSVADAQAFVRAPKQCPLLAVTLALGRVPAARRPTLYFSAD